MGKRWEFLLPLFTIALLSLCWVGMVYLSLSIHLMTSPEDTSCRGQAVYTLLVRLPIRVKQNVEPWKYRLCSDEGIQE